jgi:hypothetical protein
MTAIPVLLASAVATAVASALAVLVRLGVVGADVIPIAGWLALAVLAAPSVLVVLALELFGFPDGD